MRFTGTAVLCFVALASQVRASDGGSTTTSTTASVEVVAGPDAGVEQVVLRLDGGVQVPSSGLLVAGPQPQRLVPLRRCATEDDIGSYARVRVSKAIEKSIRQDPFVPRTIPINFHVLTAANGTGAVSDATLDEQVRVLNADFAGSGFQFVTAQTDRVPSDRFHRMSRDSAAEMLAKEMLAVSPETHLNVYLVDGAGELGWATFPWMRPKQLAHHGVVLSFRSLPGSNFVPFELGRTATHEVGHYLGLLHTFEGGCDPPGDDVADTEPEEQPHEGCQVGFDTCPGGGPDPISNFMNYSNDACMSAFSKEQVVRMQLQLMSQKSRWQLGGAKSHGLTNVEPKAEFGNPEVMRLRLQRIDELLKELKTNDLEAGKTEEPPVTKDVR